MFSLYKKVFFNLINYFTSTKVSFHSFRIIRNLKRSGMSIKSKHVIYEKGPFAKHFYLSHKPVSGHKPVFILQLLLTIQPRMFLSRLCPRQLKSSSSKREWAKRENNVLKSRYWTSWQPTRVGRSTAFSVLSLSTTNCSRLSCQSCLPSSLAHHIPPLALPLRFAGCHVS